jgi:hypothetical protein
MQPIYPSPSPHFIPPSCKLQNFIRPVFRLQLVAESNGQHAFCCIVFCSFARVTACNSSPAPSFERRSSIADPCLDEIDEGPGFKVNYSTLLQRVIVLRRLLYQVFLQVFVWTMADGFGERLEAIVWESLSIVVSKWHGAANKSHTREPSVSLRNRNP